MIRRDRIRAGAGGGRIGLPLLGLALLVLALLGAASPAQAVNCSAFPDGVLDGATGAEDPDQIKIDRDCTIRNFPASNPLDTNFSFLTQPGQTDERWLVIFDNVVHTGEMACNSVAGHTIWFVNGASTSIKEGCQNLLIPVEKIDKQNPDGRTTATVGVPFTYTLTLPLLFDAGTDTVIDSSGSPNDLHDVRITDDLNATGADLTYLSHAAFWKDSGAPVPHTFSNVGGLLTFDDFPVIPAGRQIVIEITVVLDDTPANAPGTQFVNTAEWEFGRIVDGTFREALPGESGVTDPLTIAAPELVVTKTGPATLGLTLNLGEFGEFAIDVHNTGLTEAFDVTLLDRLPDGPAGGMCDLTPELLSAQVFEADGVTPVPGKGPLAPGADFTFDYAGPPTCELTLTMLTDAAVIGPDERLIVGYRTQLDSDTQDGVMLTNVAGATEWFNDDGSNPDRQSSTRTLTDGTVGVADHEDAHTVTAELFGHFFEKTVANLTTGVNPASTALPGDRLRYTLRLQTTDVPLSDLTFRDDLGELNATVVFEPGTLELVEGSIPAGADTSNTDPEGGTNGAGLLDVRNLGLPADSEISLQFDITVASGVADGTVVLNQADLVSGGEKIADSDDPNVNGQADPEVDGDEDPTRVVIGTPPAGPLRKENTQATASVGEAFRYRVTVPGTPLSFPIHDVRITDDLTDSAADLRFVEVTRISGSQPWTPINTGTDKNVVIEDTTNGIDVPAGEQVVVEITVVLEDTSTNVAGLSFTNTASFLYDTIDEDPTSEKPGDPDTTGPMTIVEPDVTVTKTGPAGMTLGAPGAFTLDVHNVSDASAWSLTLTDRLPATDSGGTCDTAPSGVTAQVFESDGTTAVSEPLVQGTDFAVSFSGAPDCLFEVTILSAAGTLGPDQRLLVGYETHLDIDTQDGAILTNVAGATEWFSADGSDPDTSGDRRVFTRTLTDGTVGVLDHEDAHALVVSLPEFLFEKTVTNLATGENPALTATPGDRLRYRVRLENQGDTELEDFRLHDELDRLNDPAAFEPGTLELVTAPAGADTSGTSSTGGGQGTGVVDVDGLSVGPGESLLVEFEVTLAPVLPDGHLVTNQSQLVANDVPFAHSDDPNVNGPADPFVVGDEDPTRVRIESAPVFRVEKISTDLTDDPDVLLAGETLRYTITVENVGNADAFDVVLRDQIPVNTQYVAGSTTLNGEAVPDGDSGAAPLADGIEIHAPEDPTPGVLRADPSGTREGDVATVVFDVVVDADVADGTVISNQGFVSALDAGISDQPSDDPTTPVEDDPTRDVVGNSPLLFAPKSAELKEDAGTPGVVDPGDVLHYTIAVHNSGPVAATGVVLSDEVPANTTYVADSTTLNGLAVGQPDGGVAPLAGGVPISSSDLTPPRPGPGEGTISAGGSAVLEFDLRVDDGVPAGTLISNQAVVGTEELPDLLSDGDGDPATGPEPTVVVVGEAQQLSISKDVAVVGGGAAVAGAELEYVVRIVNIAAVPALNVAITDDLDQPVPGQLALVDGSATLDGSTAGVEVVGSVITADYSGSRGALEPGESAVLRFRAVIDPGLAEGTTVTNTGVVTWNDPEQSASASVSVDVGGMPGVGTLSGALWHDADFDDAAGAGERPLGGWTVELLRDGQAVQSVASDADGSYRIGGVTPNDDGGHAYELRFRAPDAGARTASLGDADSEFEDGPQRIRAIVVPSGGNLEDLNLPIDPNGVVYDAVTRAPLAGATLTLLNAGAGAPLPASCFDDPVQQGQVTRGDGHYKFDLNFSEPSCPSGGSYLIGIAVPGSDFVEGYSEFIPPSSDPSTPPFSVPTCPGTADDAVPATPAHCEVQGSELAPPTSVAARSEGTVYHVHLTLDGSQPPGSSQIFNNHIPLDPVLDEAVGITKTAASLDVRRGQLVPFEITFGNSLGVPLPDVTIVDRVPAGFRYVEGSARIDDAPAEPAIDGRRLEWSDLDVAGSGRHSLRLLLAVGAGVSDGEFTNRAQAVSTLTGSALSAEASATVRVVPDFTFDCTDVIGKVFDDANRNGVQDPGEPGLPGVRLVTLHGLVATTDPHGRFHITCALVPREDRGRHFSLKLDDRTLPSGYRMSTRPLQVQRATRGKALRFQFGASIHRVVALDLAGPVFEPGTVRMRMQWRPRLALLFDELEKGPAVLRLSYLADVESPELVERRLEAVKSEIAETWAERDDYTLEIETEVFWRRGGPPDRSGGSGSEGRSWRSLLPSIDSGPPPADAAPPPVHTGPPSVDAGLPSVDAGPPVEETEPGEAVERHLPSDEPFMTWTQDPERLETQAGDRLEQREVRKDAPETVKLKNVIPPIHFESGVADIPPSYIERLRGILDSMRHLDNVRLHLVGHTDDEPLSESLARVYGDNRGLSRERAGEVAEFIQSALSLPPEAISFEWAGATQPIATNATAEGRARNRRVEVEVWYDEIGEKVEVEDVVVPEEIKRVKVCRMETVCKLRYREGHARRARVKNLIPPLHYGDETVGVPEAFIRQVEEALSNLDDRRNVTVKFVGFTDDVPLSGRAERIYGTHLALSKARARRVALAVRDALDLPTAAVASDGRGATRPLASNETARGRALNRRIQVEFWYDDPLQELPDEPQPCPDAADAERVTKVYDPPWGRIPELPIEDGEAVVPPGFTDALRRAMADLAGRDRVRLRFVGYTRNERLDRRTARVYGDDIGLSSARARRTKRTIQEELGLSDSQVEHEGRGYVHAEDVVNAGFVQGEGSHVDVQVVYDELAVLDDYEGVEVTPITRELRPKNPLALNLMRITVDGEPIDDPERSSADVQRCTDVALDRADIRFRFDDLAADPRLSVTSHPIAARVPGPDGGDAEPSAVRFRMYTNYSHFIERSEVRIFERGRSLRAEPLAVVEMGPDGLAEWRPAEDGFTGPVLELDYVLRAYGGDGRFDETAPQSLWAVYGEPAEPASAGQGAAAAESGGGDSAQEPAARTAPDPLLAGYGESGDLDRNIPLGDVGRVEVHGRGIPPEHRVWMAGSPVPVDEDGRFVAEALLPPGLHTVEVAVLDEEGNGELFLRDLELERSDWFYTGMSDLTLTADLSGDRPDELVGDDAPHDPDSNAYGRLAFYVNGEFGEDWGLTASADTREEPLEDLFSNVMDKSPESLFRRIDPDHHFPTFGDDGTVEETAPTLGKFYLKLNKDESHALWGSFEVDYLDNELAHVDRGLYGGNLHFQSDDTTAFGEQRLVLDGFAAEPGTVPSREEFRATGGSLYYLRRQDILTGSERLRIEVRDKVTGLVESVVHLRPTEDYDIDYLQGRILLTEPIGAIVDDELLVRSDGLSGNEAWLVAQYEFTPGFDEIDALAAGGRGHYWVGDFLKLGLTANRNDGGGAADSSLYAGDVTLRHSSESWFKLQSGRSEGLVSSSSFSDDGGFTFSDSRARTGASSGSFGEEEDAFAHRADLSVGVSDLLDGARGRLYLYAQTLGEGYTAPGQLALTDTNQYGGRFEMPLSERLGVSATADWWKEEDGLESNAQELDVGYQLTEGWDLGAGIRNERREDDSPVVPLTQEEGRRTDAALQLGYDSRGSWRAYGFGQATLAKSGDREDNGRLGVGGAYRVNDRLSFNGEVSHGDLGPALQLGTSFQETDRTRRTVSYAYENERTYDGLHERRGTLISSVKSRLSDSSSVFVEDRFQHGDASTGLARAVGISLAPSDRWSFSGNWELGTLIDGRTHAETRRRAGGARLAYGIENLQLSSGVEFRFDETELPDATETERETWLFRNSLRFQVTPGSRVVGKFNHSMSDSSRGQFFDGGFTEAVLGYAYRPVEHDRLHALAKYTFFRNVPTTDQLTAEGTSVEFLQKSHVAALDLTYDLTSTLSIGGKYAYRLGQVSLDREDPEFFDNDAHLYILRADWRFLEDWEGSVEQRMLQLPDLDERRSGALVTVYRYLGDHLKLGVGYNFTDFSEDLTDLGFDHHGLFFNLVGTL